MKEDGTVGGGTVRDHRGQDGSGQNEKEQEGWNQIRRDLVIRNKTGEDAASLERMGQDETGLKLRIDSSPISFGNIFSPLSSIPVPFLTLESLYIRRSYLYSQRPRKKYLNYVTYLKYKKIFCHHLSLESKNY